MDPPRMSATSAAARRRYSSGMGHLRLPAWLRRGLEGGAFASLFSMITVVTLSWERDGPGPLILPAGLGSSLVLALPVLAMGVVAVAYPVMMAATRSDAVLGAVVGWIVGADLIAILTVASDQRVLLLGAGVTVPLGVVAGAAAAPAALGGLLAAELFTPLGFGRRAARLAAGAATTIALLVLVVGVPIVA